MRKIRINRAKWITGGNIISTGKGDTKLLNENGYQCCLGFIGIQLSKKNKKCFLGKNFPGVLKFVIKPLSERSGEKKYVQDTELSIKAMEINDNLDTTPWEKEEQLKELFKDVLELEFYGDYTYDIPENIKVENLSKKEAEFLSAAFAQKAKSLKN